ncbi:MAG: hypothetical protein HY000_24635 [Planctomycetes bacterium]|nr:hypothetical protein [Planctomycetota bacterium]
MNDPVVWRLLWKEYRVQRGFWLSMAVIALAGQLFVLAMPGRYVEHLPWLFGLALGCPAFYALGCGATLFAAEREEGTLERLRVMGAPARKVLASKLGFGLASTIGLLVLLWLVAFGLAGAHVPELETHARVWELWGVAGLEFLAWGLFFSLLTKRPFHAACLGAFAALAGAYVASWIADAGYEFCTRRPLAPDTSASIVFVPARCLIVLLVVAIDNWIALHWLMDQPSFRGHSGALTRLGRMTDLQRRLLSAVPSSFVGAALFPVLFVFVGALMHPFPERGWLLRVEFWELAGVAGLDAVAWGTLLALVTRSTLRASCLAALVALVSCQFVSLVHVLLIHTGGLAGDPWVAAMPARLVLAGVVLAIDIVLAVRWQRQLGTAGIEPVTTRSEQPSWSRQFGRLVWQELCQARRAIALFCGLAAVCLLVCGNATSQSPWFPLAVSGVAAALLSSLMGSFVFLAEQEGQHFRFFADRGLAARQVWLGKHAVWLPATLLAAGVVYLAGWFFEGLNAGSVIRTADPSTDWWPAAVVAFVCLFSLLGYCAGQLASMLIARGLLAGLTGVIITSVLAAWSVLMAWLRVDLFWTVGPWVVVLLLATWMRAPDWFLDRRSWRAWLRTGLVLAVPTIALPVAVAAYRVFEIPAVEPGFSPEEFMRPVTPEERETAKMYLRAMDLLHGAMSLNQLFGGGAEANFALNGWEHATREEREWVVANRESLELTLAATQRPHCAFSDPRTTGEGEVATVLPKIYNLVYLLLLDARRLEDEAQLDAALDRYLSTLRLANHLGERGDWTEYTHGEDVERLVCERMPRWAAHPDQTRDQVRTAIRQLERLARNMPRAIDSMKAEYVLHSRLWSELLEVLGSRESVVSLDFLLWRFLWPERIRATRLLAVVTAWGIPQADGLLARMDRGESLPLRVGRRGEMTLDEDFQTAEWVRTTPLFRLWWHESTLFDDMVYAVTRRRALRLVLALNGFRVEHGELPEKLADLRGAYFDILPLDPRSGKQFGYRRDGFSMPVLFERPYQYLNKPGQPILWSDGRGGVELFRNVLAAQVPGFVEGNRVNMLESAWSFPLQ